MRDLLDENDFTTPYSDLVDVSAIMDDSDRIIAYGHIDEDDMVEIASDYLILIAQETELDEWFTGRTTVTYEWARKRANPMSDIVYELIDSPDLEDESVVPVTILTF